MKELQIIGIDEVGRGPIAGPVAVCSFICLPDFFENIEIKTPLRDSKKLSKKQREECSSVAGECIHNICKNISERSPAHRHAI